MAVSPYFANLAPEFRCLPAPSPDLRACVIIPARDEARHISAALDALAEQCQSNGQSVSPRQFEILLLCNNCCDQTAPIARNWARAHPEIALHVVETTLEKAAACVGTARRILMDAAYLRLARADAAICSTDADTRVDPFWLAATWAELENGASAVGGRIFLENALGDCAQLRRVYLQDTVYRLLAARLEARLAPDDFDAWPRHFQFFGASIAIRPDVYAQIGGLPRVPCLEDMELERVLRRADVPIRRSPWVRARTSARRAGRVECGLSTQLAHWHALEPNEWLVPSGRELALHARLKHRARGLFCAPATATLADYARLADELFLPIAPLCAAFENAQTFGALWDDLWRAACETARFRAFWPPVEVALAMQQLRALLEYGREK